MVKPTTLKIDTIKSTWKWQEGDRYYAKLLQNDELDTLRFNPSNQNFELLDSLIEDDKIMVTKFSDMQSGRSLFFDLLNPHLQKYNVRKAISLAIDKSILTKMLDGHNEIWNNPVWPYYSSYNPDIKLVYDYTEARDLMRGEGYFAQETNDFNITSVPIPPSTITIIDDIIAPVIIPYFFLTTFIARKLKKRKIN